MYEVWFDGMFLARVEESDIAAVRAHFQCFVDRVSSLVILF